jgi:LSD1 subclass zinc finger protein
MDTHRPALLEAGLYEDDGQILDEVYEYQSFLQSKMYAAGVTCGDCRNAHSLKPAAGNVVCARCHQTTKYDTHQRARLEALVVRHVPASHNPGRYIRANPC